MISMFIRCSLEVVVSLLQRKYEYSFINDEHIQLLPTVHIIIIIVCAHNNIYTIVIL